MKKKELLHQIANEVRQNKPNKLEQILENWEQPKGEIMMMKTEKNVIQKRSRKWIPALAATAAAVLLAVGGGTFGYQAFMAVDSTVGIDVNPSIELKVNKQEKVLEVNARNNDAKQILKGMQLDGTTLETAVNAIIGSMVKNGYISEIKNSILISVDNRDGVKGQKLQNKLTEEIDALLQQNSVNGAVMGQVLKEDDNLEKLADQYRISVGKAALIQEICKQDKTATFDQLAKMSVNDLNLLIKNKEMNLHQIVCKGQASDKAYITKAKAKDIALAKAGLNVNQVTNFQAKLDQDDGVLVYEVEFVSGNMEYEFEIDALSGKILNAEKEPLEDKTDHAEDDETQETEKPDEHPGKGPFIGMGKAKAAVLNHAGVTVSNVKYQKAEFDQDDSAYEIEFTCKNMKYEYKVDAITGKILSYERSALPTVSIPEAEAKRTVLVHAGVQEGEIQKFKIELEENGGQKVYEIQFIKENIEYEYEVCAETGKILKNKTEQAD